MGDGDAVVGEGHALRQRLAAAVKHLPLVEHAAAAVHHQRIGRKILGKVAAGAEVKVELPARVPADPARQLDGADVLALPVVRAALGFCSCSLAILISMSSLMASSSSSLCLVDEVRMPCWMALSRLLMPMFASRSCLS